MSTRGMGENSASRERGRVLCTDERLDETRRLDTPARIGEQPIWRPIFFSSAGVSIGDPERKQLAGLCLDCRFLMKE